MRYVWVFAVLAVLLASGCSNGSMTGGDKQQPRSVQESAPATDEASAVMRDILGMMGDAVAAEPSGDVSHGLFLGRITRVEPSGTGAFVVDFVTPEMQPGVSKEQREKSSWPGYFGWNRFKHPQRFRADRSTLITGGLRFEPVSMDGFVREYKASSESGSINYYLLVSEGEIEAVWPWQY
jgi:hypothetical protein